MKTVRGAGAKGQTKRRRGTKKKELNLQSFSSKEP